MPHRFRLLLGSALVLGIAAAAILYIHRPLPAWVPWTAFDRSLGTSAEEPNRMVLENKSVYLYCGETLLWQSDREIAVQNTLWCDIDRDGGGELLLLCWRQGKYGESRPFWETENDDRWSQHIFIYDWTADGICPIWMASDIGMAAVDWQFSETQRLTITDRTGKQTAWDWISWGLSHIPL